MSVVPKAVQEAVSAVQPDSLGKSPLIDKAVVLLFTALLMMSIIASLIVIPAILFDSVSRYLRVK